MANNGTEWVNSVDVSELTETQRKLYEAYRNARKAAGIARSAFETAMQSEAPDGMKLIFNYRFGGLSVAAVDGQYQAAKAKPVAKRKSLADYLLERGNG